MEEIARVFVNSGYFRVRISSLTDFDKIIGGMAWAMQVFSRDINIDVFYKDSLDLGQKIALTERLVMVLLAMRCPYSLEPHQIVGLDYANLLPAIRWLIKRSQEIRAEHEAFNRLLALRHYHRVTNNSRGANVDGSRHVISLREFKQQQQQQQRQLASSTNLKGLAQSNKASPGLEDQKAGATLGVLARIDEQFKDNKRVSFVNLASVIKAMNAANESSAGRRRQVNEQSKLEEEDDELSSDDGHQQVAAQTGQKREPKGQQIEQSPGPAMTSHQKEEEKKNKKKTLTREEAMLSKELDTELLATNQKILNLLRKLDSMPSDLEIMQYQRRYVELHQQLISKNKDVKKLYDLFNSLDSIKYYLTKEINLLDSILANLDLTNQSMTNRDLFMKQFQDIIHKIQLARVDVQTKLVKWKSKCDLLNAEYMSLMSD